MIEVQGLTKRYGRTTAVEDLNFYRRQGRDPGISGAERRREDHHHARADVLPASDAGQGNRGGIRCPGGAAGSQEARRVSAGNSASLYRHARPRDAGICCAASRACRARSVKQRIEQVAEKTAVADVLAQDRRQSLEGLPPARGPGRGADPRAGSAGAGRADRGPRSEADHRDPQADPRAWPGTIRSS